MPAFFLSKSVCRTFSLKSPITPSEVTWSAPKIQQRFGQLTEILICQSRLLKQYGTKLSRGEGRNSFLLTPTRKVRTDVRTYGDVITKFSRMNSLPNFITHGAPLRLRYNCEMQFLSTGFCSLYNALHIEKTKIKVIF